MNNSTHLKGCCVLQEGRGKFFETGNHRTHAHARKYSLGPYIGRGLRSPGFSIRRPPGLSPWVRPGPTLPWLTPLSTRGSRPCRSPLGHQAHPGPTLGTGQKTMCTKPPVDTLVSGPQGPHLVQHPVLLVRGLLLLAMFPSLP